MSAGHRERARKINNHRSGHEQTSTLVLRRYVRLSVGSAIQDGHEEA
jgi:hypothetical protein